MTKRKSKTLINVLGAGRSGTTMLDLMLGSDDNAFSLGEVHAWFRPFRKHHRHIDCNCGDRQCAYWNSILPVREADFFEKAFDQLNVEFLIDSSKNLVWAIDNNRWAQKNDIKVINIVMYKPILNYVYSIWKRGESVDAALYRYKKYYLRLMSSGIPVITVSFSELVSCPENVLQKICEITGQVYSVDRTEFWKYDHHHIFGSGGVRAQSRKGTSEIQGREDFPLEFESLIPLIKNKIENDNKLNEINHFLFSHHFKKYNLDPASVQRMACIISPYWYYTGKAKSIWRRYFPERYDLR
jgi:hypothetical protein